MLKLYRRLKKRGLLSINQRNSDYVLKYNQRKHFPLVDDKLRTKKLAMKAAIAVPELYTVIHSEHQLKNVDRLFAPWTDMVIKPAHGAGGDGILVIQDKVLGRYRQINGHLLSTEDIRYHLSRTLSGAYSLGGHEDFAIVEHRVEVAPFFSEFSYEGVPDVRVICVLGYPALAMLRLPTRLSGGKANLHQGAIGAGVSLATGRTLGGVSQNDPIDIHPDTLQPIAGRDIPAWDSILDIAARCYDLTGLGYLGVDIVIDKTHGPMMLELNARPGLNIQIANREGAVHRYRAIEAEAEKGPRPVEERIAFSKRMFS